MNEEETYSTLNVTVNSSTSRSGTTTQKRRASPSLEGPDTETSRKRLKEDQPDAEEEDNGLGVDAVISSSSLVDDLAQELQCGCCSELVYRPVLVVPCQHFFCGSCCVLWIRNGGTNCPACRSPSTIVTPFRALQSVMDTLLRAAPHKARTERERQQADEFYKAGHSLRLPSPREASPEPNFNQSSDYARPCPHCLPTNQFGWRCPQPIPDPNTDPDRAWHLNDGLPPGHAHCGNCENMLATGAPTTTRCDFCLVSFCGIGVQGRCLAAPLISQHPHGMSDIGDLIQSADVYECFDSNTIEVEIMLDYLSAHRLTPRHIYREVMAHIQSHPRGFTPLMELELFSDLHGVAAGTDPDPDAPRRNICRLCAAEVLLWGMREWWVRERQKGLLDQSVLSRKDCPEGSGCGHQKDLGHAREFNHILDTRDTEPHPDQSKIPQASHPPPQDPSFEGLQPRNVTSHSTHGRDDTPIPSSYHIESDFDIAQLPPSSPEPRNDMDLGS